MGKHRADRQHDQELHDTPGIQLGAQRAIQTEQTGDKHHHVEPGAPPFATGCCSPQPPERRRRKGPDERIGRPAELTIGEEARQHPESLATVALDGEWRHEIQDQERCRENEELNCAAFTQRRRRRLSRHDRNEQQGTRGQGNPERRKHRRAQDQCECERPRG